MLTRNKCIYLFKARFRLILKFNVFPQLLVEGFSIFTFTLKKCIYIYIYTGLPLYLETWKNLEKPGI